jgi:hypothetical protein
MKTLNHIGKLFARELAQAHAQAAQRAADNEQAEKVHIGAVGSSITGAYEKLRNASENAEETLLLQRAIRRFYRRMLITPDLLDNSGEDLIIELTLAGYLKNDTITRDTVQEIDKVAADYMTARKELSKSASGDRLHSWTVDVLAAHVESLLNNHAHELALANLAYNYFIETVDPVKLFGRKPASFEAMLLAAAYATLLKYDDANIRYNLAARYGISPVQVEAYRELNQHIDRIFKSKDADRLTHFVSRHGAEFRVLARLLGEETLPAMLDDHAVFSSTFQTAVQRAYTAIRTGVNRGVWRSVAFLIITKFIIGVIMEVPYDIAVWGYILWLPLIVNLAFPPVYMVLLRLTLMMPGHVNSRALGDEIDTVLYTEKLAPLVTSRKNASERHGKDFQVLYALVIGAVLIGVGYLLMTQLHFEWTHLTIFYMFVSAASFLSFRLSRSIREVEVIDGKQSVVTLLRDFLYMPFVAMGQWISERYEKLSIVSRALDIVVELPLKTILRWLRQWSAFLGDKKDEL